MEKIYISELASPELIEYLANRGHQICMLAKGANAIENVDFPLSCHPDILFCQLTKNRVFHGNRMKLGKPYPKDIIYNGCSTGKYFIHNLKYTDPDLLKEVDSLGLKKIHVSQGYSKCNIAVIDENSIITSDRGIAGSCAKQAPDLNVLLIEPGGILLPGYNTGFIGGTCGLVEIAGNPGIPDKSAVIFNGDLSTHSDFCAIMEFIEARGKLCMWFDDIPLTDIGSIIAEC